MSGCRAGRDGGRSGAREERRPYMLREIYEEPERAEILIERETKRLEKALARFREQPPPVIFVAGRGTSDNAGIYGRYLFEHFLGIPVSGAALSLFTLYPAPTHLAGALAIGLSQSGESPDVVKAMQAARKAGAFALAVTNSENSSLARAADHTLILHARKERAVAATKTYISELVAMVMISRVLSGKPDQRYIDRLPDIIRAAIESEPEIAEIAPNYRYAPRCLCLARGFNYATVREVALKLMETCYLGSTGMSAADFLHGPIAFIDEDTPVMTFVPDGPTMEFMLTVLRKLKSQGVDAMTFTNRASVLKESALGVCCRVRIPEPLTPIPFATLGQLFAYHLAVTKGLDPDSPRRLTKVTRTL